MEFYEVLERRRTMRDMSDREVSEGKLERIIAAAFKAPTNDHLRQFEFVVVRDAKRIAELTAPLAGNIAKFTIENMLLAATAEGLVTAFHVPIEDEAEYVKRKVNAPAGYELPCLLAIGYPADGAHVCVQKEIDPKTRIHTNGF